MKRHRPCDKCKDSPIKGHIIRIKNDGTEAREVTPCECYIKWKSQRILYRKLMLAKIPTDTMNIDFSSYQGTKSLASVEKLKKYINKFEDIGKKKCLYLYGTNGTQKTTLSWILGKEILKKYSSMRVRYTDMDSLVKALGSEKFSEENTKEVEECLKVDLLIIDECFSKDKVQLFKNSNFQIAPLTRFLKERIEQLGKAIIFISNTKATDIEKEGFSESIQNLVSRNTINKILTFEDEYWKVKQDFEIEELWN